MTNKASQLTPYMALHPGELLKDENADMLVRMQSDYDIYQARHNNSLVKKLSTIRNVTAML